MIEQKLNTTVDEIYSEFIKTEVFFGLESLIKSKGFSHRAAVKIRALIYNKYGKDNLIKISRVRTATASHKNRTKESYVISPEWRNKMIDGMRRSWNNNEYARERSRKNMRKYCAPRSHTKEANAARIESRRKGDGWSEHSLQTRKKLSDIFKIKWKSGDYDTRPSTIKSKGQLEVCNLLSEMGFNIIPEFRVFDKPFDVGIPDKNTVIEFNGTYWHLDPRIYEAHYYDNYRKMFAWQIWKKDAHKIEQATKRGYKVITIWQSDWDYCNDKKQFLCEVLK